MPPVSSFLRFGFLDSLSVVDLWSVVEARAKARGLMIVIAISFVALVSVEVWNQIIGRPSGKHMTLIDFY